MMEDEQNNTAFLGVSDVVSDEASSTLSEPSKPLGVALLILFVVCLLILLWVLMIVVRFLLGLGS